ncbi:MAG: tetratricopeptide repeat protein [Neomegalonema sp.]|nr:tetratricopeptide repeat protein [Neomegalonema sp.]
MSATDAFGYEMSLEASANQSAAIDAWNKTVHAFLAHSAQTPVYLGQTLELAPDFALAHAAKGFFMLLLGRRELVPAAQEAWATAATQTGELTAREQAYIDALKLYLGGSLAQAASRLDAVLKTHPGDALLLKLVHAIRFVLGDAPGMRRSIEDVLDAYDAAHSASGYVNGCYAFALEETGDYLAAERRGRDAMMMANDDAWGLHAVAHVMDMTGRSAEGVTWISRQPQAWSHCNNFGYHVWWHLALFHLDRGEHARVLELYDTEIRREKTDDYRDISNGASLLMRLELEGVDVGPRWEEMAEFAAKRTDDGCVVFADLHYALALNATGRCYQSDRLLASMRAQAERKTACMDQVAADTGVPAALGLRAFSEADYAGAYAHLSRARPQLHRVGGSHAQRDVFERVSIEAALRAGLLDEAQGLLQERLRHRGAIDAYAEHRLARIAQLRGTGPIAVAS